MEPSQIPEPIQRDPTLQGWVCRYGRWELWWAGRSVAIVQPDRDGAAVSVDCRKMWQIKRGRAASANQGMRHAERWCAARLLPDLPLREAVVRLTDSTPIQPARPLPGLPPTREQQLQAQRLDEAAATAAARIREALEPIRPPAAVKPRAKDSAKARVRAGRRHLDEHRRV